MGVLITMNTNYIKPLETHTMSNTVQLSSDIINKVETALNALKQGKAIVMIDDAERENEGDVIVAAQFATPQNINFMVKHARGLICAPLTQDLATHLELTPMYVNNQDPHQTAFTVSVDFKTTTTGISASERATTLKELSNPDNTADMFNKPGHIFPLIAKEGGVLTRRGHTEAAVDLMKLAQLKPVAIICEILKDDGEMAREGDLKQFCAEHALPFLSIEELVQYQKIQQMMIPDQAAVIMQKNPKTAAILPIFKQLAAAHLPTHFGDFEIIAFPNANGTEPHLALVKKGIQPTSQTNTLVRVHSECLTGDIFSSKKCDCEAQLHYGLSQINESSQPGVLIYLRQEGRGIGLIEKIKAYALQDQGQDTIEANLTLGHAIDSRDFGVAAQILKSLNINTIELITNNPQKQQVLSEHGIKVAVVHKTPKFETPENKEYLSLKAAKMGHTL